MFAQEDFYSVSAYSTPVINAFGSTSSTLPNYTNNYTTPLTTPFSGWGYETDIEYNRIDNFNLYENETQKIGLFAGLLGGKQSKYEDYCYACYAVGVTPLPIDAWSNGQWDGHPNLFHPKSPTPTGYEDLYWKEHPDDPGLPIGEPLLTMFIMLSIYCVLKFGKKVK